MENGEDAANTFRILLATDCHLGYMERDAIRGSDAITTFEEILQIAVQKDVDFVLLGGDLFHENKPSRRILYDCMCLLRKYCMGDKPVQFEFLSDQSENFKHSGFPVVNYEDPNLNISLPIFSIHGNHDDPAGLGSFCTLDLLSTSGLVNYFGKCLDLENVQISPLLFQKGETKLSLYGLGSIRDERLHRLFREGKVSMLRPREKPDEWFNICVIHQNRSKHGPTNYIPEQYLDNFLDLVFWGHEHECRIKEEWNSQQSFYVTQPGSSVATSLCHGEAVPKHVGLLEIKKKEFKIIEIPLKTVRPFYIKDIDLDETSLNLHEPDSSEKVIDYCKEIIETFLPRAIAERSGHPKQPQKPLIRLRVYYPDIFETFSVQRFGQSFVDRVANPKDIILFTRKKVERSKVAAIDKDALNAVLQQEGLDKSRVEDFVKQYFELAEENKKLSLLSENGVNNAVQEYVDKEVTEAITLLINLQLEKVQRHLKDKNVLDESLDEEIKKFKLDRQKNPQENREFQNALKECAGGKSGQRSSLTSMREDEFLDDDTTMEIAAPVRGRGRGRGRARGTRGSARGRGRGKSSDTTNDDSFETNQKSSPKRSMRNSTSTAAKNASSSKKVSSKQGNISSFFNRNSNADCIDIDDDDDDITFPSKRRKTVTKAPSGRKGIAYDTDTDESPMSDF